MSKTNYESVSEFHAAFGIAMPDKPTPLTAGEAVNRMAFDVEETIEFLHASSKDSDEFLILFNELVKRMRSSFTKQLDKPYPQNELEKLIAQADALVDKKYFNSGDFTLINVNPDPLFELVHVCNMKKIWPDGKAHYNEFGKIVKPEGWEPPEPQIEEEINRQLSQ